MPRRPLPFSRPKPAKAPLTPFQMSLGDVLFRLALIAPDDYAAIDTLARSALRRRWPANGDELFLLKEGKG